VGWPRPLRRRGRDDFPARLSGAADATGLARHHPVIAGRVDERFIIQALTAIAFVTNIVGHATDAVSDEVQLRVIAYWARVDAHLGAQVAAGLGDGNGGTGGHPPAQVAEVVGGTREPRLCDCSRRPWVHSARRSAGVARGSGADVANPDVGRSRRAPPDVLRAFSVLHAATAATAVAESAAGQQQNDEDDEQDREHGSPPESQLVGSAHTCLYRLLRLRPVRLSVTISTAFFAEPLAWSTRPSFFRRLFPVSAAGSFLHATFRLVDVLVGHEPS
jgi:catalase-related immune-responsive protein